MPDPAPGLLDALKAAAPKLLSRKLLVALVTKASILGLAWLAAHGVDHDIALHIIDVVVPTIAGTGAAYLAAQGWVDRHEVTAEGVAAEVKAGIDAGAKPAPPAPAPAVTP